MLPILCKIIVLHFAYLMLTISCNLYVMNARFHIIEFMVVGNLHQLFAKIIFGNIQPFSMAIENDEAFKKWKSTIKSAEMMFIACNIDASKCRLFGC